MIRITFTTETTGSDDENGPLGGDNLITCLVHDFHCKTNKEMLLKRLTINHEERITVCDDHSSRFLVQDVNNIQAGFQRSMCWNIFVDFDVLFSVEYLSI